MSGTGKSFGDHLSGPRFDKLPSSLATGGQTLALKFSVVSLGLSHEVRGTVDHSAQK